jgi:hypothetical protein
VVGFHGYVAGCTCDGHDGAVLHEVGRQICCCKRLGRAGKNRHASRRVGRVLNIHFIAAVEAHDGSWDSMLRIRALLMSTLIRLQVNRRCGRRERDVVLYLSGWRDLG